jgi:hypothetical protein
MLHFFRKEEIPRCSVSEESRLWLENSFQWLADTFGKEQICSTSVLTPHFKDFPIAYNGETTSAQQTLQIVARQMSVPMDDIQLDFYEQGVREIDAGGLFGNRIFLKDDERDKLSAGLYWGRNPDDGKYHLWLEKEKLKQPELMVATLAHEIAHIKLLGEGRLEENDERLTDLTTVVFGLGIFNANAAFQDHKGFDSWGYSKLGYLKQMEWGYALALFARFRNEQLPDWTSFLTPNIKGDFKRSMKFIEHVHRPL